MARWIDTHCHLDADDFSADIGTVRRDAAINGVALCVIPSVAASWFYGSRELAHQLGDAYALGTHPLFVPEAADADIDRLGDELAARLPSDERLVAVGEIGLDLFVPELTQPPLRERQEHFLRAQLKLARRHGLPAILHVRRSVDQVLKAVRDTGVAGGIAHAFNGSAQQAAQFIDLGFKLGFGGALTYDRATRLRELARTLPLHALVMETDSPDIPPHWLYVTAEQRAAGQPQGRNTPAELPRIGAVMADLRGITPEALAEATTANACAALPRLVPLLEKTRSAD